MNRRHLFGLLSGAALAPILPKVDPAAWSEPLSVTWDAASGSDFIGLNVYCNGELVLCQRFLSGEPINVDLPPDTEPGDRFTFGLSNENPDGKTVSGRMTVTLHG